MKKRLFCTFLACTAVFMLGACGNKTDSSDKLAASSMNEAGDVESISFTNEYGRVEYENATYYEDENDNNTCVMRIVFKFENLSDKSVKFDDIYKLSVNQYDNPMEEGEESKKSEYTEGLEDKYDKSVDRWAEPTDEISPGETVRCVFVYKLWNRYGTLDVRIDDKTTEGFYQVQKIYLV